MSDHEMEYFDSDNRPVAMIDPGFVAGLNLSAYHEARELSDSLGRDLIFLRDVLADVDKTLDCASVDPLNETAERVQSLVNERDQLRELLTNIREYVSDPRCAGDDHRISRMIDNSGLV